MKIDPLSWITDNDAVAIVVRQYLRPIDGYDSPIFPPTFAMRPKLQRHPYNIDQLSNGRNICLIDSIASQSNRIEPIFDGFLPRIVPKVIVKVASGKNEDSKSLLEIGHRVADAVVRFSDWAVKVSSALANYAGSDALPLVEIAPTSLVFGAWNSRDAGEKIPRLFQSTIRATNVDVLTRASQYVPPFEYKHLLDEKGVAIIDPKIKNDKLSGQGLLAVPVVTMPTKEKDKDLAFRVHGGVMVNGDIRRDASVNLINLRAITTPDKAKKDAIRPYLLGLSLIALLYEQDFNLRQGCLLVPDTERTELRKKEVTTDYGRYPLALVRRNGKEEELNLLFAEVLDYAKKAAEQFIVNQNEIIVNFRADIMKAALKQAADEPEGNES